MSNNAAGGSTKIRVRLFVDFWNFSLSLRNETDAFKADWSLIGPLLSVEAAKLIDPTATASFEAMHVYGSFDPTKGKDAKLKNWFANTLDKMAGVHVIVLPRQKKKGYPKCPDCYEEAKKCHGCGHDMRGTEEKGVDTRIVTDMISLAWSNSYDVAVLISADRDFVPVADFLQNKGIKVIHGAFPPKGSHLSQRCWASIKLPNLMNQFSRTNT